MSPVKLFRCASCGVKFNIKTLKKYKCKKCYKEYIRMKEPDFHKNMSQLADWGKNGKRGSKVKETD